MGKCTFCESWLSHNSFKAWVRPGDNKFRTYCTLCKKSIELGKMGEAALSSHSKSKKHMELLKASKPAVPIGAFLNRSKELPSSRTSTTSHSNSEQTASASGSASVCSITSFTHSQSDVLKAEIIWTLKVVTSHYSFRSCEGINEVFSEMFPDSKIARSYSSGESKTSYLATYGIARHFLSLLKLKVKNEDSYVLLFDETLNHDMQRKQVDIHVRIWEDNVVKTSYLNSEFLGHATATDLQECLDPLVCDFGYRKLLQLSMDGPSVNWKLYRSMQDEVERHCTMKMLETGSCGLHVVHNAFRNGSEAAGWNVDGFLSSLHTLFHDAAARCDDFQAVTGSSTLSLPLKFCKHRWVENIKAAERAIFLLPQVVEYCNAAKSKTVTCPTNASFAVVQKAIKNPLITAQLQFFLTVARQVEPFLWMYQTDKPMLPFIAQDLGIMLNELMEMFIKPEVIEEKASSLSGMIKIDVKKKEHWVDVCQVKTGFAAQRQLLKTNLASDRQKAEFRMDCRNFLVALVDKLLEKSPIMYPLVRLMPCLDPRQIATLSKKEANRTKMTRILSIMVDAKRVVEGKCDTILKEYSLLVENVQCQEDMRSQFNSFSPGQESSRIDSLLHSVLASDKQYAELWGLVKQLLLLSHGQASVERGFSVNKEVTAHNIGANTIMIIARRHISEHVMRCGGVPKVPITKELILSASSARSKYHEYLEEERKKKAARQSAQKRKQTLDKVADLRTKKARFEEDISNLVKKADKLCEDAEEKGTLTLLCQANALRSKSREKQSALLVLQKEIDAELESIKDQ